MTPFLPMNHGLTLVQYRPPILQETDMTATKLIKS